MEKTPAFHSPHALSLYQRIAARSARTCVIGLGYAGLPLAVEFGRAGFTVLGIDTDKRKCDTINSGHSDIEDVPGAVVAALVQTGTLRAVPEIGPADHPDTINICVPTPLRKTRDPDLSYVVSATQTVKTHLRPGMLVILESTTYPGTTQEIVRVILEETGLKAGSDFFLAFSPERVDPGNASWNTGNVPKVVGGLTPDCTLLATALYQAAIDQVVTVSSPGAAEMVKLLENTFRAINIGLVNEMALLCDRIGIDVWEVIEAATTKPFGFMPFYPGPGLGGHCIPVDPVYLSWKVKQAGLDTRFIDLAAEVNEAMPHHVVNKIADALNEHGKAIKGASILLMGVAYKRDVSDVRESPALDVMTLLLRKGARVSYHDPFVPHLDAERWTGDRQMDSVTHSDTNVASADCVVVLTDHSGIDYDGLAATARLVVDARNAIRTRAPHIFRLGAPNPIAGPTRSG